MFKNVNIQFVCTVLGLKFISTLRVPPMSVRGKMWNCKMVGETSDRKSWLSS